MCKYIIDKYFLAFQNKSIETNEQLICIYSYTEYKSYYLLGNVG